MPSRRRFLALAGATSASLAGCLGLGDGADRPEYTRPSTEGPPPEPDRHVFASDGRWSSLGFDGANTRWDYGGSAPRDGGSVRWRRSVGQLGLRAPTVSDGRVFVTESDRVSAVDAASGETTWVVSGNTPAGEVPTVRDGRVYTVADGDLLALDAATGEQSWSRSFSSPGTPTMPATVTGEELVLGVGEAVRVVSADDGSDVWSRRLRGEVGYPALLAGRTPLVATESGGVYSLGSRGEVGVYEDFASRFTTAPTVGRDRVFVTDVDGTLRALGDAGAVEWSNEGATFASPVVYTDAYVYGVAGGELHALDTETGEEHWTFDVGESTTAPAVVGDTLYVGGDRLYALDPTGGGDPVRFAMDLGGDVRPDVSAGDGVLYVPVFLEDGGEIVAVEPQASG